MSRGFFLVTAAVGVAVIAACTTDYQKGLDDPNYGAPNALAGQQPPPASQQLGAVEGTSSSSGGATTTAAEPLCQSTGGALIDGGACSTSFATAVLPALVAGGCDAVGCHGGPSPANQPKIDGKDPLATYTAFAQYKATNGKPYIDPCSIDPNDSVIAFNIDPAAPAASKGTEMPPSAGLAAAVTTVTTWVKCGAPNN